MSNFRVLLMALLLPGLAVAGIYVGNPVVVAQVNSGTLTLAEGWLDEYVLDDCDGHPLTQVWDDEADLLHGVELNIPSQDWCSLTLRFSGDLDLAGSAGGGWTESVDGSSLVLTRVETSSSDLFVLDDVGAGSATVKLATPDL